MNATSKMNSVIDGDKIVLCDGDTVYAEIHIKHPCSFKVEERYVDRNKQFQMTLVDDSIKVRLN